MIYSIKDIFPVYKLQGNCMISTSGDITLAFKLDLPEVFSLSQANMDDIHTDFYKFVIGLPPHTIIHKQDINLKKGFSGINLPEYSFLEKATKNYFNAREYLEHNSFLYVTLTDLKSVNRSYKNTSFFRNDHSFKEDTKRVISFTKEVNTAISTLNSSQYLKAYPLEEDIIKEIIFLYYNGFEMDKLNDIEFKPEFKIGNNYFSILALNNEENQSDTITNCKVDITKTTDKYTFYKFFTQSFGLDIQYNHIVNQIIYVDEHLLHKEELQKKIDEFNRYSKFNVSNEEGHAKLTEYLREIERDEKIRLCRSHFNVIYFANSKQELVACEDEVKPKFRELDIFPYTGSYIDFVYYFLGSCPGGAGRIPKQETFYTDLSQGLCYFYFVTNYKSDKKGILLNERLYNLPVIKDLWDEPYRTKQITARNFAIIADTGGGKSFLTNHLFRQFIEQNYSLVLCDIGDSYEVLAKLYKDKIAYVKYKEGQPLGINPFKINSFEDLEADKIRKLCDFVFIHWKKAQAIKDDASERVSMNMLLTDYYKNSTDRHSFPSFYNYIKKSGDILKRLDINPEFFNIKEFLHICSEYVDGIYDFVYADKEDIDQISDKQGAIFELSDILKNPNLLPMMFLSIQDAVDTKIWKNSNSDRKVLVYEETAKLITFDEMFTAISYAAQTVRKYDGGLGIILQTIDNMPYNEVGNAIINNTHTYYIFEPKKGIKSLQERLNLSDHDINQVLSIRSNTSSKRPYTEFTLVLGNKTNCYRLEVPKEAYYSFLSEKSDKKIIFNEMEKCGDIEKAIKNLVSYEKI
jgi:conjugal transfer ATP-binding protein TraC